MLEYERQQGLQPTDLFTQSGYDKVAGLIMQTQVVGATPQDGIGTDSSVDWPLGATISDADKSDLALQGGTRLGLLLLLERNRDQLLVPTYSDGFDVAVPRELLLPHYESQVGIHANDRFTLEQSNELFPDRAANVAQVEHLCREVRAGRMDWAGALTFVTERARTEALPSRGSSSLLVPDPHDLVPELVTGLRGEAPGVQPVEPVPAHLRTARDIAGIDLTSAVVLSGPSGSGERSFESRGTTGGRTGLARG